MPLPAPLAVVVALAIAGCMESAVEPDEDDARRSAGLPSEAACDEVDTSGWVERTKSTSGEAGNRHGAESPVVYVYGSSGSSIVVDLPCQFLTAQIAVAWDVGSSYPEEAVLFPQDCDAPAARGPSPIVLQFDAADIQAGGRCIFELESPPSGPVAAWFYESIEWEASVTFLSPSA